MKNILLSKKALLLLFTFYSSLFTFQVLAQSGALDPGFGNAGIEVTTYPNTFTFSKLGLQRDGKIIAVGTMSGFSVLRYLPNGTMDSSFGINGLSKTNFVGPLYSLAIQNDDKILLGGGTTFGSYASVIRLLPNGTIDSSFGTNGIYTDYELGKANAKGIAVDNNGNIVFGGSFQHFNDQTFIFYPYVSRLTSDGILDKSFGNNGRATNEDGSIQCSINALTLSKNGKIVLAGNNAQGNGPSSEIFVAMFTAGGKIDSSFKDYHYGYVYTSINADGETANDVYIKDDGKILVAGSSQISSLNFVIPHIALVQYNPDGSLDESFGNAGAVEAVVYKKCFGNSMKIQQNGKIVVGGQCIKQSGENDFVVARFQPDGSRDSSFGVNGFNVTDFGYNEKALSVCIQKDGNIVLGGSPVPQIDSSPDVFLARYIGDSVNQHPLITKIKTWIRRHILNFEDNNPNAAYYVVEKSNNEASGFTEAGRIQAESAKLNPSGNAIRAGAESNRKQETRNETYSYTLPETPNAKRKTANFYRIKTVNKDGNFSYSDIVADKELTNQQSNQSTINIYPNPAKDKINIQSAKEVNLQLQNSFGQVLFTQKIKGSGSIDISKLKAGAYYLVDTETGENFKVVKE